MAGFYKIVSWQTGFMILSWQTGKSGPICPCTTLCHSPKHNVVKRIRIDEQTGGIDLSFLGITWRTIHARVGVCDPRTIGFRERPTPMVLFITVSESKLGGIKCPGESFATEVVG